MGGGSEREEERCTARPETLAVKRDNARGYRLRKTKQSQKDDQNTNKQSQNTSQAELKNVVPGGI